jgi:hypothetical protein
MRSTLALLVAVTALAAIGAASAAGGNGKIHYAFVGQLTAVPANGAVSISVTGGNKPALRAMLGQPVTQTFAYGDSTEFLRWQNGIPTVVSAGDLAVGDYVRVNLRAARGTSLANLEQLDSPLVGDHGTDLYQPTQPLYLFRGRLTSVGTSSVTVDVGGGNAHALRLLIGQTRNQTFATGDETIFLLWQGKVPTVISLSQLKVGDRIVVRVRADKGSSLSTVESTAAVHVGDREPASS